MRCRTFSYRSTARGSAAAPRSRRRQAAHKPFSGPSDRPPPSPAAASSLGTSRTSQCTGLRRRLRVRVQFADSHRRPRGQTARWLFWALRVPWGLISGSQRQSLEPLLGQRSKPASPRSRTVSFCRTQLNRAQVHRPPAFRHRTNLESVSAGRQFHHPHFGALEFRVVARTRNGGL